MLHVAAPGDKLLHMPDAYLSDFHGPSLAYVLALYERYRQDPGAVDAQAQEFFAGWSPPSSSAQDLLPQIRVEQVVGATNLAQSIREYGHMQAQLDPLGSPPPG